VGRRSRARVAASGQGHHDEDDRCQPRLHRKRKLSTISCSRAPIASAAAAATLRS
jgi:hypothetical protein